LIQQNRADQWTRHDGCNEGRRTHSGAQPATATP